MGSPDEFEAVTIDGLQLEPSPSPSPDSEDEWNRRELKGKNRRELKGKKGGKGKEESSCGSEGKGKKGKNRRELKGRKGKAGARERRSRRRDIDIGREKAARAMEV